MKGKTKVIVMLFVILAFLLGPALYNNKLSSVDQPKESSQPTSLIKGKAEIENVVKDRNVASTEVEVKNQTSDQTSAVSQPVTSQQKDNTSSHTVSQAKTSGAKVGETGANVGSTAVPAHSQGNATPAESKENQWIINLAVVGMNGELLYGPSGVAVTIKNEKSMTVLDVLDASGLAYTMSNRYPGLVDSIANQRNRGQGGWMYKINNQSPMLGASQMEVKKEDKVIWWYSQSINVPAPEWDQLK
ncbi:DUF4430 domain-containing protein [Desulfotomaculum defluvii]